MPVRRRSGELADIISDDCTLPRKSVLRAQAGHRWRGHSRFLTARAHGRWSLLSTVRPTEQGRSSCSSTWSTLLPRRGIATFVYDRRGEGASGGKAGASLTVLADDARAAVGMVSKLHLVDPRRIGLWGLSQGGWIAPMAAADNEEVAFLVAVSASGVSPAEQMTFATANLLREKGFAEEEVERATALRVQFNDVYRAGDSEAMLRLLDEAQREPWFRSVGADRAQYRRVALGPDGSGCPSHRRAHPRCRAHSNTRPGPNRPRRGRPARARIRARDHGVARRGHSFALQVTRLIRSGLRSANCH